MEGQNRFSSAVRQLGPAIILAIFALTTAPAWIPVFSRWTRLDESYSHGFLLLLVTVLLCLRTYLRSRPEAGFYPLWFVPLVPALLIYAIGDVLMIEAVQQLMLLPLLLGGLAVIWGWEQVKRFIVPVGILFFAIPVWDFISWPLQRITVLVNQLWLAVPGIEFEVEGIFVYLTGVGAFEIAHGCSGLRYLLVGLTLSVLYGELNYRHWQSRVWLAVAGVLLALLANWIRVFVIIFMGYITDMETSLIEDHDTFGWWVFAVTLVPLFLLGRWLEGRPRELAVPADTSGRSFTARGSAGKALLSVAGLYLLSAVALYSGNDPHDDKATRPLSVSPLVGNDWAPLYQRQLSGWSPEVKQPDWLYRGTFFNTRELKAGQKPDMTALVGLYSYEHQRLGREVVQYGNRVYDSRTWKPQAYFQIDTDNGAVLQGLTLRLRGQGQKLHIAYGYYVEGRWETDPLRAKLAQLHGAFNGRSDASLFAVGLHCEDCDGQKRLEALSRELRPRVQQRLDEKFSRNGKD